MSKETVVAWLWMGLLFRGFPEGTDHGYPVIITWLGIEAWSRDFPVWTEHRYLLVYDILQNTQEIWYKKVRGRVLWTQCRCVRAFRRLKQRGTFIFKDLGVFEPWTWSQYVPSKRRETNPVTERYIPKDPNPEQKFLCKLQMS
jgi:hypothetical protein